MNEQLAMTTAVVVLIALCAVFIGFIIHDLWLDRQHQKRWGK